MLMTSTKEKQMNLYYFNMPPYGILRLVTDRPLEINENGIIHTTFGGRPIQIPAMYCFYFEGKMCLDTAPKEIATLVEKGTDRLEDVVFFFSGFHKFVAPHLLSLNAEEKTNFRDSLYSFNQTSEYVEHPAYCDLLMIYLDFSSKLDIKGLDFNVKQFFTAIRKGKN
jgi:hypothetical protein